jgi:hypothetical protein
LGIDRIQPIAKITPQQLKLVSIEWKLTHKVYQEAGEAVEGLHTVALYVKGKDAVIYDPPFNRESQPEEIPKASYASGWSVLVAKLLRHQNLRGLQLWIGGDGNFTGECNRMTQSHRSLFGGKYRKRKRSHL